MKKRDKYIRASENIVTGRNLVCCSFLAVVGLDKKNFTKFFKSRYAMQSEAWFGSYNISENQLARSLALLFMAELDK